MIERGKTGEIAWIRSGTPVELVLLHGFSDSAECWLPWFPLLEASGFLAYDVRGHGRSGLPEETLGPTTNVADFETALLGQDVPPEGAVLLGHSMGAAIAVSVAARRPELVRAVVLEDPPFPVRPVPGPEESAAPDWFLAMLSQSVAERIERGRADNPSWADDELEPWARSKDEVDPHGFELPGEPVIPLVEWLPSITCPVLLVHGDASRGSTMSAESVAACAKAAAGPFSAVHVGGAGHNVRRDQREAFRQAVNEFLTGL